MQSWLPRARPQSRCRWPQTPGRSDYRKRAKIEESCLPAGSQECLVPTTWLEPNQMEPSLRQNGYGRWS
eukprot:11207653-Lingulodinium_polyedra.AAC.1